MKQSRKQLFRIAVVLCLLLISIGAFAQTRANPIISRTTAILNPSKTASLIVLAKTPCDELGAVSYTLYKKNGTHVTSATINDFGSGLKHSCTVDLSSYIVNGNSYYLTAYFSADGETANVTSGIRAY